MLSFRLNKLWFSSPMRTVRNLSHFRTTFFTICVYLFAAAVIGFIGSPYQANEIDGFVNVTFGVLSGELQRESVGIQISDGTALSKLDIILILANRHNKLYTPSYLV